MNTKILFFDIDGTLLGKHEYLPITAVSAIKQARANSQLCFVCSGRSMIMVPQKIQDIGFDGYICAGGTYISVSGKIITDFTLDAKQITRILKWFDVFDLELFFEAKDCVYHIPISHYTNQLKAKHLLDNLKAPLKEIDFKKPLEISAGKFSGLVSPMKWDYLLEMADDLSDFMTLVVHKKPNIDKFNSNLTNTPIGVSDNYSSPSWSGYGFVEFLPNGFNKATAITRVLDYLSIPLANSYAFGDSENDREMLALVPNSVCMGNGDDNIKKIASYIAPSLDENGIYEAMKHFSLI